MELIATGCCGSKKYKWVSKGIRQIKPDGPDAVSDVGNEYTADRRKLRGCRKGRIIHTPSKLSDTGSSHSRVAAREGPLV